MTEPAGIEATPPPEPDITVACRLDGIALWMWTCPLTPCPFKASGQGFGEDAATAHAEMAWELHEALGHAGR